MKFAPGERPIYVVHGEKIRSLEDFYREVGEAVNGPGGYFGKNLDALWDCLKGGFGTPETGGYILRWTNCDVSRESLGYEETARQLTDRRMREDPSQHDQTNQKIRDAKRHIGPTAFEWLVDLLSKASAFGVELQLR
jgi:RNAse (barnase) inhibitor barstar